MRNADFKLKIKVMIVSCLVLSVLFATQFTLLYWFYPLKQAEYSQSLTIVLDAGHGGIDGGVVGTQTKVKESDLNLEMCVQLKKLLEDRGVTVIMTRKNSDGLYGQATSGFKLRDMKKRKEIIEGANADLVVSVHMNRFSDPKRKGPQVFSQIKDEKSEKFAAFVQSALNAFTGNSHAALKGDFFICQCVDKPSIIVECGFLSNAEEEAKLCDKNYRQQLGEQIVRGIFLFLYS